MGIFGWESRRLRATLGLAGIGALIGAGLAPAAAGDTSSPWRLPAPTGEQARGAIGQHEMFIVPVYWAGTAPAPLDEERIKAMVANAGAYYSGVSGGQMTTKYGWTSAWQKLSLTETEAASCDREAIRDKVRAIVGGGRPTDHLVVYLNNESACDFTDLESVGPTPYGDGYTITNGVMSENLFRRIISINAGATATGSLDCTTDSTPVPLSGSCAYRDANDPWDPTSNAPYGHVGMPMADSLWRFGLVTDADFPRIETGVNTSVTIAPLTATSGKRGFSFDDGDYRYLVDYRVPAGQDDWIDDRTFPIGPKQWTDPGGGVIVHRQLLGEELGPATIDFHPDGVTGDTNRHPGLERAESYTSPDGHWSLRVGAASSASATISITFPNLSKVLRWSGADRFATSAAISAKNYGAGVAVAYVASGQVYTDALSGAPVAGKTRGPVLLVDTDAVPGVVAAELTRLRPRKIVVFGGPATIAPAVEAKLGDYTSGEVVRWSGADRFATSAAISAQTYPAGVDTVLVASGRVFTDALSGAPVAGRDGGPVLLVDTDALPAVVAAELERLAPRRIVVLGGPATISERVVGLLDAYSATVERWAGADRFSTSAQITGHAYAPLVRTAYIASGRVYTDALSGAPVAGKDRSPVLLVDTTAIPDAVRAELTRLKPRRIVIFGGPATVSTGVQAELAAFLP